MEKESQNKIKLDGINALKALIYILGKINQNPLYTNYFYLCFFILRKKIQNLLFFILQNLIIS